jgi:hypothetical protein
LHVLTLGQVVELVSCDGELLSPTLPRRVVLKTHQPLSALKAGYLVREDFECRRLSNVGMLQNDQASELVFVLGFATREVRNVNNLGRHLWALR